MESKGNTGLLIGFVMMTFMAAVFGYLYYQEKNINLRQESAIEARVTELAGTQIRLDSISQQLDMKILEVQKLGGDVTDLRRAKSRLERDRTELVRSGDEMKLRIEEYERFLARKDEELIKLRAANQTLTDQNEALSATNSNLVQEKQKIVDSISGVITKSKELEHQVVVGAALRARNVRVFAISEKGKIRDGSTVKSRRLDKVRVDFTLEKNPLTKTENKKIVMRIVDPTGATIADASTGSGTFDFNGLQQTYTISKEVPYTNNNQEVTILYDRSGDFKPGAYVIELFSEGFKIGEGSFTVK